MVAIDEEKVEIVGFIHMISDGMLSAYISLLKVLPNYQDQGIGSEFVHKVLAKLNVLYMIDLCCHQELQPYYEHFGMHRSLVIKRNLG